MMRCTLCALLLLLTVSTASAQGPARVQAYLSIGPGVPLAPTFFKDYWNVGAMASGGFRYPLSKWVLADFSLDFNRFTLKEDKYRRESGAQDLRLGVTGGDISSYYSHVGAKVFLREPVDRKTITYAVGGIGVYHMSTRTVSFFEYRGTNSWLFGIDSETTFAADIGLGFDIINHGRLNYFMDVRYVIAFTRGEPTHFIPIRFGVRTK